MSCSCLEKDIRVDRVEIGFPYEQFYYNYLVKNRPCLLSEEWTKEWDSRRLWVKPENGKPNLEYLKYKYGSSIVPVADCNERRYDAQVKSSMRLCEYISMLENGTANIQCLYLKDWHWSRDYPQDKSYTVPQFFSSDWLNEFCTQETNDDYKFVYIGPKGSWTPFHADVFRSHSWSANVCGRKKWLLCPPGCEHHLQDKQGNLPYELARPLPEHIIEVEQRAGEVIFVPSNWYHQVHNLEDTISINHNWFNGSNIDRICNFFVQSLEEVQQEISDCREMDDWDEQCQLILKALQGMDFTDFSRLIAQALHSRLKSDNEIVRFELNKGKEVATKLLEQVDIPSNVQKTMQEILHNFSS